jgi:hypothetical protein
VNGVFGSQVDTGKGYPWMDGWIDFIVEMYNGNMHENGVFFFRVCEDVKKGRQQEMIPPGPDQRLVKPARALVFLFSS